MATGKVASYFRTYMSESLLCESQNLRLMSGKAYSKKVGGHFMPPKTCRRKKGDRKKTSKYLNKSWLNILFDV